MATLSPGQEATIDIPPHWTVAVTPATNSAGRILRLSDDGPNGGGVIPVNAPNVGSVGPFDSPARCRVVCDRGALFYELRPDYTEEVTSPDVGKILKLTQAAYDALESPDESTLYMIVG